MSKKQWMVLLMLFLTYLLLGAAIFYHIESRLEIERVEKAKRERIEINALLHTHYVPSQNHDHDEILGKLTRYCGKSVYNYTETETDPLKWDFYNSFYFAYTVVSTIGYGNLAPTNMLGRILMIFYGLVGIPINGILLTQLGEFFGRVFVKAHQKYKSYKLGRNDYHPPRKLTTFETGKVGLAAQIFAYLTPGFVMFIFFPAFLFSHYEGWNYDEAVYYAFVTLTTIGFGDYVAGQDNSKGAGIFFVLYKIFLICWISFGLGYIFMIMTFIAQGMRSKKITRIEHKLAVNLKHTQSKIWSEFNKEMNYLRRVFNELQFSKVKRVYVDECNQQVPPAKLPRSNSFPDLRGLSYGAKGRNGDDDDDGIVRQRPRRRANSEVVATDDQIARVVSETDLQRIDKTATFASHAMVQPAELLARLVNILGYMPPATEDPTMPADYSTQQPAFDEQQQGDRNGRGRIEDANGVERCLEKEQSAGGSGTWTIGNERILPFPPRLRSRAASEIRLRETKNDDRNVEWTWSGPIASKKIQELMKARTNESSSKDRGTKESAKFSKLRKALLSTGPWRHRFSTTSEKKSTEFERREINGRDAELTYPNDRRDSTFSSRRHYYTHTGGTVSAVDDLRTERNNLLEETSLADFLRALTLVHATVTSTTDSWIAAEDNNGDGDGNGNDDDDDDDDDNDDDYILGKIRPRRKMGTACLTPPKLPSLFTLFSSPPSGSTTRNNESTSESNNNKRPSLTQTSRDTRRSSLAFVAPTVVKKPRRFSLRPVATPVSPPTPPRSCSPFLSDARRAQYNKSTFLFESPKESLIRTEGGPGLSSPIKLPAANDRRSSLRSPPWNHGGSSTVEGNTTLVSTLNNKAVPRWKAGMLQRQIGQTNLRRRVRAFSLSDVYAEDANDSNGGRKKIVEGAFDGPSAISYRADPVREKVPSQQDSINRNPAKNLNESSSPFPTTPFQSTFPNVRFEDETIRTIANDASIKFPTNETNERKLRLSLSLDKKEENFYPDSSFPSFRNNVRKQSFSNDSSIRDNDDQRTSSIIDTDAGSQESLTEVKVETSTGSSSLQSNRFCNSITDILQNHPPGLAQPKVKQYQVSPSSKKTITRGNRS